MITAAGDNWFTRQAAHVLGPQAASPAKRAISLGGVPTEPLQPQPRSGDGPVGARLRLAASRMSAHEPTASVDVPLTLQAQSPLDLDPSNVGTDLLIERSVHALSTFSLTLYRPPFPAVGQTISLTFEDERELLGEVQQTTVELMAMLDICRVRGVALEGSTI